MTICNCTGPINGQLFCPCQMRSIRGSDRDRLIGELIALQHVNALIELGVLDPPLTHHHREGEP